MSDQDRKLLWGKAHSRCAICKRFLVNVEDEDERGVVVGIECHIIGHSEDGPRGKSDLSQADRIKYENMILMCMEHSKTIDERTDIWTVDKLKTLKKDHEREMMELVSPPVKISPLIKLIEPTGASTGGPGGHFNRFTIRNFGRGEALGVECWVEGWGYQARLQDIQNRSYLDEKTEIPYELRVDGTPIYTKQIPFLKLFARYKNLDDQVTLYSIDLRQVENCGSGTYDIKISGNESYEKLVGTIDIDDMIMLDSRGDYDEALYRVGEKSFKIRVSRTQLSCWNVDDEYLSSCFRDLGRANLKIMAKLNAYQDREYSTYSFPDDCRSGNDGFKRALEQINKGLS